VSGGGAHGKAHRPGLGTPATKVRPDSEDVLLIGISPRKSPILIWVISNPDHHANVLGEEIMALRPEIVISMKRIEIVVDEESLRELTRLFREAKVQGYTIIKGAGGLGSRGERNPDDYVFEDENAVMVIACEEAQAEKIINMLQPRLREFGGMCIISDCQWVTGPPHSY
jgi:nitrogen regulatory protein PII